MKQALVLVFLALCVCMTAAPAQTNDLSSLLDKDVLVVVGPAYLSGNGTPQAGGTVGTTMPFTNRLSGGIFADLAFRKTGAPQTNVRGQVSYQLCSITIAGHDYPVNLLEDVGTAFAASDPSTAITQAAGVVSAVLQNVGTNVGYIAASGVGTDIVLGKSLHMQPYIRVVKGSLNDTAWTVGIGFGFAVHTKRVAGQ
jgi:hypothetical protein